MGYRKQHHNKRNDIFIILRKRLLSNQIFVSREFISNDCSIYFWSKHPRYFEPTRHCLPLKGGKATRPEWTVSVQPLISDHAQHFCSHENKANEASRANTSLACVFHLSLCFGAHGCPVMMCLDLPCSRAFMAFKGASRGAISHLSAQLYTGSSTVYGGSERRRGLEAGSFN